MAEKRMFTMKIVDSDDFLEMPLSTQCLYFHLNMRADDDGFINNPKKVLRMINASEDDLKLLITKRFVLIFESGVIVIKHWRMHNTLRKDRYKPTYYQEQFQELEIKENGAYTERGNQMATSWQPNGNQLATQYSIDKYSIDKNSINNNNDDSEKSSDASKSTFRDEFDHLWKIYPNKKGSKKKAFESYKRARKKGTTFEAVEKGINDYVLYIKSNNIDLQYVKHGSTFFNQNAWEAQWLPDNVEIVEDDGLDGIL